VAADISRNIGRHQGPLADLISRICSTGIYFGVGLLVTNTSFTKDAVWTAQQERNSRFLRLRDFIDLKRWLQDQYGTEADWREIPARVELAPGVVIEIPKPRIVMPFDRSKP
jgi:hypothetical protein